MIIYLYLWNVYINMLNFIIALKYKHFLLIFVCVNFKAL